MDQRGLTPSRARIALLPWTPRRRVRHDRECDQDASDLVPELGDDPLSLLLGVVLWLVALFVGVTVVLLLLGSGLLVLELLAAVVVLPLVLLLRLLRVLRWPVVVERRVGRRWRRTSVEPVRGLRAARARVRELREGLAQPAPAADRALPDPA